MNINKKIILQPEYVKSFVCDGAICEDNCCQGYWNIFVDEKSYKKIKKVGNTDLKKKIDKYIRRNRSNPTGASYGKIHQDKDINQCVFLTENKLCEMQKKLGADYLCNVCMVYPRSIHIVDNGYERSLTMSCPLAAKEALLNPNPMVFEQFEEVQELRLINDSPALETEGHLFLNKPQRYFWDIRIFSIGLLQNRNYSLADRLIVLGIVYKKIEELYINKNIRELPTMLSYMSELIELGSFKEDLQKVNSNIEIQLQMTKMIIDMKSKMGFVSKRYLECLTETLLGVGYIEDESFEDIIQRYKYNYEEYYTPYMKEKEYILENYLVNEYFKEMLPFGKFETIWDSYIFLCLLYSMVKLHLIGISGLHLGLTDDMVLKLIQSLTKEMIHNERYIQGNISMVKNSGYDSLAYMSILVKN